MAAPIIEVRGLGKEYREQDVTTVGLASVDITIKEGEFVAIVGPSGSGKSTLLQILGCLDRPTKGTYRLAGKDLTSFSDEELAQVRNEMLGFVFQAFNLMPRQSVLENVKMPLIYADIPEPARTQRAQAMVDLVGLTNRSDFAAAKLSGGQKQRVAIARALVNNPRVIFADEPTGSLDSRSGEVITRFLQDLNDQGNTIVLVTHESYVAMAAKRMVSIRDGVIESDTVIDKRRIIAEQGFEK
ncbi:MAG: ABC transporter ATP-binding protein [Patescibacteria group bacterium]